jgi:hypothetical protein
MKDLAPETDLIQIVPETDGLERGKHLTFGYLHFGVCTRLPHDEERSPRQVFVIPLE